MFADGALARDVAERQVRMFSMFVGQGLYTTRAALAAATGIGVSSLREYAAGAAMPLAVALALSKVLPAEAINMMLEPAGKRLCDADATATNWDGLAAQAAGLVADVCTARADGHIDHTEDARLRQRTRTLIAEAQGAVGL